jgi:hypothetical protein
MIPEFIDFCTQLFPSIDPYTKEQAKKAMEQFENVRGPVLTKVFDSFDLYQGDIFSEIPFFYTDEAGEVKLIIRKAQLLSNTCDASRDTNLLFAALHPLDEFKSNPSLIDSITKNKRYSTFYIPGEAVKNEYVDFELITTMSRENFLSLCQKGKVRRITSLSLVGYYMFLCKMTVFLMRPEDVEVNESR